MKTDTKAYLASSLLHIMVVGSTLSFAAFPQKPQEPILVDFTVEQGEHAETREMKGASSAPPAAARSRSTVTQTTSAVTPPVETPQLSTEPTVPASVMSTVAEAVPIAVAASQTPPAVAASSGVTAAVLSGKVGSTDHTTAGTGTGGDISGTGDAPRGESAESLRARYLKEHFAYIRDLIAGNLRYPGKARRMGWSGKLSVEFVVRESGAVDKIRVVRSSNIPLLDSDAEETVRRSAPFPKPPVSARLVIPVEYVLE